jgi:hypothetical protein
MPPISRGAQLDSGLTCSLPMQSTGKRSGLGTVREAELYGGVLHTGLSREYLTVTADFMRGDEYDSLSTSCVSWSLIGRTSDPTSSTS